MFFFANVFSPSLQLFGERTAAGEADEILLQYDALIIKSHEESMPPANGKIPSINSDEGGCYPPPHSPSRRFPSVGDGGNSRTITTAWPQSLLHLNPRRGTWHYEPDFAAFDLASGFHLCRARRNGKNPNAPRQKRGPKGEQNKKSDFCLHVRFRRSWSAITAPVDLELSFIPEWPRGTSQHKRDWKIKSIMEKNRAAGRLQNLNNTDTETLCVCVPSIFALKASNERSVVPRYL